MKYLVQCIQTFYALPFVFLLMIQRIATFARSSHA